MGGKSKQKRAEKARMPTVSVCTPTFNRRPFIPMAIHCFEHQTYPADKIEWIIIDDGTDSIEDLVAHLPRVKYYRYETKLPLGKKRNLMNSLATGEIIVYADDDDYYPPERIAHAVETLKSTNAMIAGTSAMYVYFKCIRQMKLCGPFRSAADGGNHATAASFAFRRELLSKSKFTDEQCMAEEVDFLHKYKTKLVQLDPRKTILVISHKQCSFDKSELLKNNNPHVHDTDVTSGDFITTAEMHDFLIGDGVNPAPIDVAIDDYNIGGNRFKPDVVDNMNSITQRRMVTAVERQKYLSDTAFVQSMLCPTAAAPTPTPADKQSQDRQEYATLEEKCRKLYKVISAGTVVSSGATGDETVDPAVITPDILERKRQQVKDYEMTLRDIVAAKRAAAAAIAAP